MSKIFEQTFFIVAFRLITTLTTKIVLRKAFGAIMGASENAKPDNA